MNKDLTVGKPSQVLWQFCLPCSAALSSSSCTTLPTAWWQASSLAKTPGCRGQQLRDHLIFIAFAFGCNIGCSVIVSRYFGAKEYDDMKPRCTRPSSARQCCVQR